MKSALLSVYIRPDRIYLNVSDRATTGVWISSDRWDVLPSMAPPQAIGEATLRLAETSAEGVKHPDRHDNSYWKASIAPVMKMAKVRSWTAFTSASSFVQVRLGDVVTICPMRRDGAGFSGVLDRQITLDTVSETLIGSAVLDASTLMTGP